MQKFALIVLTGLASLGVAGVGLFAPATASAATFSKEVGEPLKRAQAAMQKRQWDVALGEIRKAQAAGAPEKKPQQEYQINEMLAYVLLQQKDNQGAARIYEAQLNSGLTPEAQVAARVKTITLLYVGARNWAKAIEYGNRWVKAAPGDPEAQFQLAQAYYTSGDCKNAARNINGALEATRKGGQQPKENWLNMKLDCQSKLNDEAGMIATREQLVRYYPNKNNWKAVLVNIQNTPNMDDRATLAMFRLMNELDVLDRKEDYVEMAQMLIETVPPRRPCAFWRRDSRTRHWRAASATVTCAC
ncbi:MAG: hypothetical protein HC872_03420 [Gammaproteobacteria bacterium]|nr:hypothetical protein [Gammaproteobacteria bacterium]